MLRYMMANLIAVSNNQSQCLSILVCGYLGGFSQLKAGQLLTIEEVGGLMRGTGWSRSPDTYPFANEYASSREP